MILCHKLWYSNCDCDIQTMSCCCFKDFHACSESVHHQPVNCVWTWTIYWENCLKNGRERCFSLFKLYLLCIFAGCIFFSISLWSTLFCSGEWGLTQRAAERLKWLIFSSDSLNPSSHPHPVPAGFWFSLSFGCCCGICNRAWMETITEQEL